jgi:transposase
MSELLDFSANLTENRRKKQPLSSEARVAICGAVTAGQSISAVAQLFGIARVTVYRTVQRYAELNSFKNRARSGRPRKLTPRDERYLLQLVRRFPKITWRKLVDIHPRQVSIRTLQRILKKNHLRKWISKKRPRLVEKDAKGRRQFCCFWRGREEELAQASVSSGTCPVCVLTADAQGMFSDECSIQSVPNSNHWVFRYGSEKYRADLVNLELQGGGIKFML